MAEYPSTLDKKDAGAKIRSLLQQLQQEFESVEQHHEAIVQQQNCLLQMARLGMDIEDAGSEDKNLEWPVLTFDVDTGENGVHVKKQSVSSVLSLMQKGADRKGVVACDDGADHDGRVLKEKEGHDKKGQHEAAVHTPKGAVGLPAHLTATPTPTRRAALEGSSRWKNASPKSAQSRSHSQATPTRMHSALQIASSPLSCHIEEAATTPRSKACESNATGGSGAIVLDRLRDFSKKFMASGGSSHSLNSLEGYYILKRMRAICSSPWFEAAIAVAILMNAMVMCVEFQYYGEQQGQDLGFKGWSKSEGGWARSRVALAAFEVLEWIFGLLFTLELTFKFAALKMRVIQDMWNWIDIISVAFFVFEKTCGNFLPTGGQVIRLCRLARLTRLIKLVRTVEGFDHLYLMTTAIKGSVKILAWALLLLLLIQVTVALTLGQVLQVTYFEDDAKSIEKQREIFAYFGTFSRSVLSMFEMTLANWPPICRMLTEEVSEWFMLLCVVHKLTIGFAVVGVINGVFMQETFKVASNDDIIRVRQKAKAMAKHSRDMRELFNGLDNSGDGTVGMREFCSLADYPAVKAWLNSMEIRTDDLETMFHLMDTDESGHITFDEMLDGMERLKGHARSVDLFALLHARNKLLDEVHQSTKKLGEGSDKLGKANKSTTIDV